VMPHQEDVPGPCPWCDSGPVEVLTRQVTKRTDTSAPVQMVEEFSHCVACGKEYYTPEQSMAHSRAYASAVREADRLMSPEAIRNARLQLGLTQDQFERALGVGKKTVVRWERGTVAPSQGANAMLWLAGRYPSVFMEYAQERFGMESMGVAEGARVIATISHGTSDGGPVITMSDGEQVYSVKSKGSTAGAEVAASKRGT
jgi:putative zinc finger/helix-turn-helix YgiT family protein